MVFGYSAGLTVFIWIVIIVAVILFFNFGVQRIVKRYIHYPIPAFAARFIDNPVRRIFQSPKKVVDWIGITRGMWVLEIGPGPGTFSIEAAKRVGDEGRFFALDLQESIISRFERRLRRERVTNVSTKVASAHHLPFPDNTFDRVFMVAVLGEIPDKHKALSEVRRVLKDSGLLAIGELFPDPDYPRRKSVVDWCDSAGLQLVNEHGNWLHYLLTFKKSMKDLPVWYGGRDS